MPTPDPRKLKAAANIFLCGGLALALLGFGYLTLSPKVWNAAALVRIEERGRLQADTPAGQGAAISEQPLMAGQYQLISSDALFGEVITNPGLLHSGGSPGVPASTNAALLRLRARTQIRPIPSTSVFEVKVTGYDGAEDARIANEIVRVYCDRVASQRETVSGAKFEAARRRWDEQNQKLTQAQNQLSRVTHDVLQSRLASTNVIYDPESIADMRAQCVQLKDDISHQRETLDDLKTMSSETLRQVLPTMTTNALLDTAMARLASAQRDLAAIRDSRPNSLDAMHATSLVDALNREIDGITADIVKDRETDLELQTSLLAKLGRRLAAASTNAFDFSTNNPAYVAALRQVQLVQRQRDAITNELIIGYGEAAQPLALTTEVVEPAETPSSPASPDRGLGITVVGAGVAGLFLGLLLLASALWARRSAAGVHRGPALL
jgi:uncharacterized protein involved in exopolysaccharide biosynthesis